MIAVLFPHFALLRVELIRPTGCTVRIQARGREPSAACPGCGTVSRRVHSGYERKMSDTAISNQQAILQLRVRRFFCGSSDCPKKTFAEQIPGLTFRHGRCTMLLRTVREAIALALGGRAGARLAELRRSESARTRCCGSSGPCPTRKSARCESWASTTSRSSGVTTTAPC
ncbi:transposase family protein [Streptomyces netropsis]|uniref:transposase family protein n=1 Tax=Streptomyces netropsis TaxID=55404 RepID=UPI0037B025C8